MGLADAADKEDLVVHGQSEEDGEHQHRHERRERCLSVDADVSASPAFLQDQRHYAVRRPENAPARRRYVTHYPYPKPTDDQMVIEVAAAASLCGTDREGYEWTPSAQAFDLNLAVAIGHEGAGTVVEVGPQLSGLWVGDPVALASHLVCGQCFP
jgi:hypothetical protein